MLYIYFNFTSFSQWTSKDTLSPTVRLLSPKSFVKTSVTDLGQAHQSNSMRLTSPQAASLQLATRNVARQFAGENCNADSQSFFFARICRHVTLGQFVSQRLVSRLDEHDFWRGRRGRADVNNGGRAVTSQKKICFSFTACRRREHYRKVKKNLDE